MTSRRVYIAGPIAGRPNGNREAFERAEARLLEVGYETVNPHRIAPACEKQGWESCRGDVIVTDTDGKVTQHGYGCYMVGDLMALLTCQFIYLLPGWEHSRGAKVERAVADICGIEVCRE